MCRVSNVPCGVETALRVNGIKCNSSVSNVPCGVETYLCNEKGGGREKDRDYIFRCS